MKQTAATGDPSMHGASAGDDKLAPARARGGMSPDRELGPLLRKAHYLVRRVIDTRIRSIGLTASQWPTLVLIAHEGIDTPYALAQANAVNASAMTRTLDSLQARGLLLRRPDATDGRVTRILLTRRGAALARETIPIIREAMAIQLQGLTVSDTETLLSLLRRVVVNSETYLQQDA